LAGKDASLLALARMVAERFDEDRCLQIASSLTFTTLLAIVPVVTIVLTVASAFPVYSSLIENVRHFVVANLVPSSVNAITDYAERFSKNAAGLTAVGIFFLGITALMLMSTIEGAFNDIWRITWQRRLLRRIVIYATALTLGPLLIGASLSLTSYLITLSLDLVSPTTSGHGALLRIVPLVLTTAALSLLYFVVPNREVAGRDALVGGIVAGALFEVMKHGFGFYVTHFPTDKLVYGAFAMVPIFLLWIYLSWLIVLGGAVLAAELPEWRENAFGARHVPGSDFFHALRALESLWRARGNGDAVSTSSLHAAVKLRVDRLEWMLAALAQAGYVERTGVTGWRLTRHVDAFTVRDVYHLFVFDLGMPEADQGARSGIEAKIHALADTGAAGMEVPLAQFFSEAAAAEARDAGG
jgi:membrane protein